jgi:minor extracellular serine protease Vpr
MSISQLVKTSLVAIMVIVGSAKANPPTVKPPVVPHSAPASKTALTSLVLKEYETKPKHSFVKDYYGIDPTDSNAMVGGILKLHTNEDPHFLSMICTHFHQTAGSVFTFKVKLGRLAKLVKHPSVEYVALARMADPLLQKSRQDAGADKVHAGLGLPMPFTGKGVIAGIVDIGIDYTCPAFRNDTGDSLRIVKAWSQVRKRGRKPVDFGYGVEFESEQEILQAQEDSTFSGSHGTVTTSAFAASGYGSDGKYTGFAPGTKMILVSSSREDNSLLDGTKYIFDEAKKMGKRAVVNLSWGGSLGPHDGTTLFDQAIDSLVGAGNVLVGAAGNSADDTVHIKHTSSATLATTSTFFQQPENNSRFAVADWWGRANTSFSVQVMAIDKATGNVTKTSSNYSTAVNQGEFGFYFIFGTDTSIIYVINTARDLYNNRPNSLVAFLHDHEKTNHHLAVKISSRNNEVHGWAVQNAWFSKRLNGVDLPGFAAGDFEYTINEIGGVSKSIITSGSHLSQTKFKNFFGPDYYFSGDSGKVARFSSKGPTLDGRTKPDLTSPGSIITAANSFDLSVKPSGGEESSIVEGGSFTEGGKTWYWFGAEATSMAAPLTAGAAALLLQVNPTLSPQQVKEILIKNTTVDNFTGIIPTGGSNQWGWGKLNVYKAISAALGTVTSNESEVAGNSRFWYNNPVSETLTLCLAEQSSGLPQLQLYDLMGRTIKSGILPIATEGKFHFYDLSMLLPGQYVARVTLSNANKVFKLQKE